jgi:hypothetical protein
VPKGTCPCPASGGLVLAARVQRWVFAAAVRSRAVCHLTLVFSPAVLSSSPAATDNNAEVVSAVVGGTAAATRAGALILIFYQIGYLREAAALLA